MACLWHSLNTRGTIGVEPGTFIFSFFAYVVYLRLPLSFDHELISFFSTDIFLGFFFRCIKLLKTFWPER